MELRDKVAAERRRLREVRQALSAAVAQGSQGASAWVSFYLAIGDYFAAAMHRLHVQDVRMGDLLRQRADLSTPKATVAMQELQDRLDGNQRLLDRFMLCHAGLKTQGAATLPAFESAARDYTNFITTNMGHHDGTTSLARDAFTTEDWEYMALTSDSDAEREGVLYGEVFSKLPDNLVLPEA